MTERPDHAAIDLRALFDRQGIIGDVTLDPRRLQYHQFTGFDGYQKVVALPEVNYIILASPPGFRPMHLEAAIKAGVSSIMPYYGAPVVVTHDGVTYDQTGMAFSNQIVNDLLRGKLGFAGYVNSDTGIINSMAWGLEDKTIPERVPPMSSVAIAPWNRALASTSSDAVPAAPRAISRWIPS